MGGQMTDQIIWEYGLYGGFGGLVAVLVKCGYIELPRIKDRKIYLGGLTGVVLGIIAGLIGDSNPVNAFMWGAGSTGILQGLVQLAEIRFGQKPEKGTGS